MKLADNATNETTNTDKKKGKKNAKNTIGNFMRFVIKHKILSLIILVVIVIIILALSDYYNKKKNATEDPNDPKNGPAAANEFINSVYIDEEGKLRTEKSIREFWNEMKQRGNMLTKYLSSAEELAKLFSASIATDFPDTRPNPDDPIKWKDLDTNVDSTEVQGIVKFKRALTSGETITMTYLSPSEFQKKMNAYNRSGKVKDRDEALKYFTLERTVASSSSSSGGIVDVGTRTLNNDVFHFKDHIDIYSRSNNLYGGAYDAVQGCCFDGKYIICSGNKGKKGKSGGRIFWININTKKLEPSHVDVGAEGGHMEGITYDSDRKIVLCIVKNKKLLQIDNQTRSKIGYVNVSQNFRQLAYSVSTHELIGYNDGKKTITFMKYDSSKNEYVEQRTVKLNNAHFTNIQGMSCDGQVIYFSDSRPHSEMNPEKYRIWVYDYKGNKVEEHKMGNEYHRGTKECENCFVDKDGTLWVMLPHELAKVKDYKANPVDWENSVTANIAISRENSSSNSPSYKSNTIVEEILEYACSWVGKIGYKSGESGELREGGKTDCGFFVYHVYKNFGLMNHYVSPKKWVSGAPGTEEIGNDLSKASPGDITWRKDSDGRCHVSIYLGNGKRVHSTPGNRNKCC